jgi:ribosome-associated translation inhibitor RaiA
MTIQPSISFHQVPHSDALEADIRGWVQDLEQDFDRITSCRVVIEAPHRHQHQGRPFEVRVELRMPGHEIVAGRSPTDRSIEHEDAHVAVRDAFLAARRQLEHHVGRSRSHTRREGDPLGPPALDV